MLLMRLTVNFNSIYFDISLFLEELFNLSFSEVFLDVSDVDEVLIVSLELGKTLDNSLVFIFVLGEGSHSDDSDGLIVEDEFAAFLALIVELVHEFSSAVVVRERHVCLGSSVE